jgi:formate C-acetyltransferase
MRAAQVEPEKYADLIVRIGGYSEYFTKLDRGLQDSVIARTEHSA